MKQGFFSKLSAQIDPFHVFFPTFDMDKLRKERLQIIKTAKFESDLLQHYRPLYSVKNKLVRLQIFRNFAELYFRC